MNSVSIARVMLAVILASPILAGSPQTTPPLNDRVLQDTVTLIREAARSTNLSQWLKENRGRMTPQTAIAAQQIGKSEMAGGRFDGAYAAFAFARAVHAEFGNTTAALEATFWGLQSRFQLAETAEQYAAVRNSSVLLATRAQASGEQNLKLAFLTLVADCAYFGSRAGAGGQDEALLLTALQDLVPATTLARSAGTREIIERLVSLTGAAAGDAMERYHREQEKFVSVLKTLAETTEQAVPFDFEFTIPEPGVRLKSIKVAKVLAELSYIYGQPASASRRLVVAETRANALDNGLLAVEVLNLRYRGEARHGAPPAVLNPLRATAFAKAQTIRTAYRSRAGRIWAADVSDELYGDMFKGLIDAGVRDQLADAFVWAEGFKARALLDRLSLPNTREVETDRTRELERTILGFNPPKADDDMLLGEMQLVSQLSGFLMGGSDDRNRTRALLELEALYALRSAGFASSAPPTSLAAVQSQLQPGEALLEYAIPPSVFYRDSTLLIVLATRNQVLTRTVALDKVFAGASSGMPGRISIDGRAPIDSSSLSDYVALTRVAIRSSDETGAKRRLQGLHEILVQPLLDAGVKFEAFTRVIVVPHGVLHHVPFPALLDRQGAFFITKAPLTVAPSASIWLILQARRSHADRLLVVANPELIGRQLKNLPYAEQEGAAVLKLAPAAERQALSGPAALKDRVLAAAPAASIIHLSTHGEFPDDSALDLHEVWLGAADRRGVGLHAAEVRRLNLANAWLVVLSVCNGGLYRIGPSDEPYGLMPAFLEAGAQNVLGTRWKLDDQFGRDFMIEFYKHLSAGPAKAYQLTAQHFISENEFIHRWAGFVAVGPGRPFER